MVVSQIIFEPIYFKLNLLNFKEHGYNYYFTYYDYYYFKLIGFKFFVIMHHHFLKNHFYQPS